MFNLFRTELLRHQQLAIGFAIFHLLVLYYLFSTGISFFSRPTLQFWLLVLIALSATLGIYQTSLHKRGSDWLYLLHRPLTPGKIFLALALAGCCLSALIILVPALLILIVMDMDGTAGIELRHYGVLFYIGAMALTGYFCGCFTMLSPNRLGFLALVLTSVFMYPGANMALVPVSVLLVAWALYLAYVSFKPDLLQQPDSMKVLLLTELPIQYGCLWLLVSILMAFVEFTWRGDNDPYKNPAAGTVNHVLQLLPRERMQFALAHSSHPDSAYLSQQLALGEVSDVGNPGRFSYPKRQQLPLFDSGLRLADTGRNAVWLFSHDAMLFEGLDMNTAEHLGWLGPDGFDLAGSELPQVRFESVPWVTGNDYVIDDDSIYQLDWDAQRIDERYQKEDSDRFADSLTVSENLTTLLSETRLYIFSTAELQDPLVELQPRAVMETPAPNNADLRSFHVLELIDGYLVAALTDITPTNLSPDFALFGKTQLQLFRIRPDFGTEMIASVPLPSEIGDLFIYKEFIAAPGIRLLTDLFWGINLHKDAARTLPIFYVKVPFFILALTALTCTFCAGLTAWLLRSSTLPLRVKIFWIACNGINGFAGLLSFLLGNYWRGTDQLKIGQASPATIPRGLAHRTVSTP